MTNERVKTLPTKELDHFLSIEFFYEQMQGTQISVQASNNLQFSAHNCPKWKEASTCYRERRGGLTLTASSLAVCMFEWFSQQPTSTFFSSSMFCDVQVKYIPCRIDRNHFSNFNKLWQVLRLVKNSVTNRSWSLIYIQSDLRSLNLFSNSW